MSDDLNHQDFQLGQNNLQPLPTTLASAASIVPTTLITYLTGTTALTNITPPLSGAHMLILVFTNAAPGGLTSGGGGTGASILKSFTAVQNVPVLCFYDPAKNQYIAK